MNAAPLPDPLRPNRVWSGLRLCLRLLFVFWLRYRAEGYRRVPRGGALLLINHQSFLDPLLVGLPFDRPVSYIVRDSLMSVPVLGSILAATYTIPVDRDAARAGALREAIRRMQHGFLVGIFPEGTRTEDGTLGPLKPGFLALMRRGGVPVIPVGIAGAFEVMPRDRPVFRPRRVQVVFGDPLPQEQIERLSSRGNERELIAFVRREMLRVQGEARRRLEAQG